MKIFGVDQYSQIGGGQRCFLDLVPAFLERGWQVTTALPEEGPFAATLAALGCDVLTFGAIVLSSARKSLREKFAYASRISRIFRSIDRGVVETEPDLVYVNGPRYLPAASLAARRRGIPLLFHAHHRIEQTSARYSAGAFLPLSQASVVACCQHVARSLRPFVPDSRLRIVFNGVGELTARKTSRDKVRHIAVIGRIEPEKGQLDFVRAVGLVSRRLPHLRFSIVGAPLFSNRRYYEQTRTESHGLPITFVDWQSDIAAIMDDVDLVVLPSSPFDALPRVLIESFSAGIPVLAFQSGGIPEVIRDGVNGFLTTEATPQALADRITEVTGMQPGDLAHVAAAARSDWQQKFQLGAYRKSICQAVIQTARTTAAQWEPVCR